MRESEKKLVYHCVDHSSGGKLNDGRLVKLSGMTTSDGATSHSATTPQKHRSNARQKALRRRVMCAAPDGRRGAVPA